MPVAIFCWAIRPRDSYRCDGTHRTYGPLEFLLGWLRQFKNQELRRSEILIVPI
jgi:hypothetical protein